MVVQGVVILVSPKNKTGSRLIQSAVHDDRFLKEKVYVGVEVI